MSLHNELTVYLLTHYLIELRKISYFEHTNKYRVWSMVQEPSNRNAIDTCSRSYNKFNCILKGFQTFPIMYLQGLMYLNK